MERKKYSEQQIAKILNEAEAGVPAADAPVSIRFNAA